MDNNANHDVLKCWEASCGLRGLIDATMFTFHLVDVSNAKYRMFTLRAAGHRSPLNAREDLIIANAASRTRFNRASDARFCFSSIATSSRLCAISLHAGDVM